MGGDPHKQVKFEVRTAKALQARKGTINPQISNTPLEIGPQNSFQMKSKQPRAINQSYQKDTENPQYVSTIDQSLPQTRQPVSLQNKFIEKKMNKRLNVSSQNALELQKQLTSQR